MFRNETINVFNHGKMIRDFTYVDDIVESIKRLMLKPASPNPHWDGDSPEICTSSAPYQIFNIGNNNPVKLTQYIEALEEALDKKAIKNYIDIQAGDVPATHADSSRLEEYIKFKPQTSVKEGVARFVQWYLNEKNNRR